MRNLPFRTASLCVVLLLFGKLAAFAQEAEPTPQEEERALEALRAGLDKNSSGDEPDAPSPFDPRSAKTWDVLPAADIAPGLYADLFQPSTETLSVGAERDWLPGTGMPLPRTEPQEERATAAASDQEIVEPPSNLAAPPAPAEPQKKSGKSRTAQKTHSTLRSGRASLDTKSAPRKKLSQKQRPQTGSAASQAPAIALPGELRP